jgi:hypothetical protein
MVVAMSRNTQAGERVGGFGVEEGLDDIRI